MSTQPGNPLENTDDAKIIEKLYNESGEFDHEQVKDIAERIEKRELTITRLNPEEEQGRIAGGRRNVEASIIAGADARTNQADSRGSRQTRKEKIQRNARIESHLENYSNSENIWFDYGDFTNNHNYLTCGQEAYIFQDQKEGFVLKAVDYDHGHYGLSPPEFLDNRISLFNYLFPATKYELNGFTRDTDGRFRFILRQPFVIGRTVHPSNRRSYLKQVLGPDSEALTPEQYVNSNYHIWDLHLKNMLQDKNGNVFIIDALLELNTPDRHLGGNREYAQFGFKPEI